MSSDSSDDDSPIVRNKKGMIINDSTEDEEYPFDKETLKSFNNSHIVRNKKAMITSHSTEDGEYSFDMKTSKSVDEESNKKSEKNEMSLITSTPDVSELRGKSYFSTSIVERKSDSDIISESDYEDNSKSESKIYSPDKSVKDGSLRNSFSTPQMRKAEAFRTRESEAVIISSDEEDRMKGDTFLTPQIKKLEIEESDTESSEEDLDSDIIDTSTILDGSFDSETPKPSVDKKRTYSTLPTKKLASAASENEKVQATLDDIVKKMLPNNTESKDTTSQNKIECKRTEYNDQMKKIHLYEQEMLRIKKTMSTVKLSNLPDKGQLLKSKFESSKEKFLNAQNQLRLMNVIEEDVPEEKMAGKKNSLENWNDLEAGMAIVQPKTFGKKGLQNYQNQKTLTAESLEQLHGSLKNCPKEDDLAEEPKGIKVPLMNHQRRALSWMMYREAHKPPGGILADDMGLGKTLTMISLVLKMKDYPTEHEEEDNSTDLPSKKYRKYNGGTLVVCPASLLNQWAQEIDNKLKRGLLSYNVYHGPKREVKPKILAEYDVVITTYSIVMSEYDKEGAIFRVRWSRIILDEAHTIRNHKAQTSIACCSLAGKYRWALTGTPVHNKELDMYALLKFLKCSPFDDLAVWKRWVSDKSSGGGERLHTVISSLMLRRTKAELMAQGKLSNLPSQKWDLIPVTLGESEMSLYQKILLFSQTLFAQFLHQKAEKGQDIINLRNPNADPNSEYFKMRKKLLALNQMTEVNQHQILVLLLRLRQICCHPSLIVDMLQGDEDLGEDEETEERQEINLLEQLNKLNLEDDQNFSEFDISKKAVGFNEAAKGILNPSNPLFAKNRCSSKVKSVMEMLPKILSTGDKIIIVSQWTSFLDLVGWHLKDTNVKFTKLDGRVPTSKRTEIVTNFNDPNSRVKVLLLSLTAGGVGLNLVGANHLFLLDLHWNPQLEKQAQDRIYRMGQKKDVNIYKFMAGDTIEERIKELQERKLAISESMMTGSKHVLGNKLTLQDLKMLFNM